MNISIESFANKSLIIELTSETPADEDRIEEFIDSLHKEIRSWSISVGRMKITFEVLPH